MEEVLLKIKEVSKHFGGVYAVNGISLDITPGKIWGLVGPNGSGKSTLFNTVLGIHQPDEGNIYFNDRCITNLVPHQIYDLGLGNYLDRARDRRSKQMPAIHRKWFAWYD